MCGKMLVRLVVAVEDCVVKAGFIGNTGICQCLYAAKSSVPISAENKKYLQTTLVSVISNW